MRVSRSSSGGPIDEDEEFKMAEQLATSFSLSGSVSDLDKKELSVALRNSYKQLQAEKTLSQGLLHASQADSLNYSVTASSRPTTVKNATMRTEDQLVESVSRSQLPGFCDAARAKAGQEEAAAG